ncbi:helix-turn-helix domain-containing protein [Streptomyces sp. NPDC050548]|uniref:nSTAND1 domain-containing NTPase n=1 Tax=Streptomyces sp. NPDC050548 TaxID=3365629 RepID=UPI003797E7F7
MNWENAMGEETVRESSEPVPQEFGVAMRRLRGERGVSLSQLAKVASYSKGYLSNIECGRKRPHQALAECLDAALSADGELSRLCGGSAAQPGECPYRGLAAFGEQDARWFFGREDATDTLVSRVRRAAEAGGGTVMLLGASGAGKSSLLRAGLLSRLGDADLPSAVVVTPTANPLGTLARALAGPLGQSAAEVEELLGQGRFPARGKALLLVVDQWEEIFALCADEAERAAYVSAVCAAPLAVLAVRADFYEQCLAHPPLARALERATVTLGAMSRGDLLRAVGRPAELARLQVEPELVKRVLEDLDPVGRGWEPSSLPLLSHALLTTWQHRSGRHLTVRGYEAGGGLRRAIAESAEAVYQGLSAVQRETARHLMLELVQVGEEGGDTRRRVPLVRLSAGQRAVAEAFTASRLLTWGERAVELSHEAVLWAWPRLAGWIDADRAGLRLRQRITDGASTWQEAGRRDELLLQGAGLAVAGQWAADHRGVLSEVEREFLKASQKAAERGMRRLRRLLRALAGITALAVIATVAAVAAVGRERESTHRAQVGEAAAAAKLLLPVDPARAAALAVTAHHYASSSAAAREAVASVSGFPVPRRLDAGTGSVEAIAVGPEARGRPALLATATEAGVLTLRSARETGEQLPPRRAVWTGRVPGVRTGTAVYGLAFTHDGNTLVVGEGPRVRLWHVTYAPRPRLTAGKILWKGTTGVSHLRLSRDGHTLAVADRGGYVLMWDFNDHGPIRTAPHRLPLPNPSRGQSGATHAKPYAVSFSEDGTRLSAAGTHRVGEQDTGVAIVWQRLPGTRADHFTPRGTLRLATSSPEAPLSPDGRTLAAGIGDGSLLLCRIARLTKQFTCQDARHAPQRGTYAAGMDYSPDGRLLAEADHTGPVRLRDPHTGRLLLTLPHPSDLDSLSFAPDGSALFAGAAHSGKIWAWPMPLPVLLGHTDPVISSAQPADGQWLATADRHSVRLWQPGAGSSRPLFVLRPAGPGAITALAASRNGSRLAVATEDWTVQLYDTINPSNPQHLGHAGALSRLRPVYAVALSPDGSVVAFGDDTKTVQLWNVPPIPHGAKPSRRGSRIPDTGVGAGFFQSLSFSPDGAWLAGGTTGGSLHVWEARAVVVKSNETFTVL